MFSGTAQTRKWTVGLLLSAVALSAAAWQGFTTSTSTPTPRRGSEIYASYCGKCHGADGNGINGRADLRKRMDIWGAHSDSLLTVLIFGAAASDEQQGTIRTAMPPMPYNDVDIASAARYVMNTFGGRMIDISTADVERVRKTYRKATLQRLRERKGK